MAYKTKSGIILRTPDEKAKRFARQLRTGRIRETGKELTSSEKAFRVGYLASRNDNAKVYCANNGLKSKSKSKY